MSFNFSLATLLRIREMVEEREERSLQTILRELVQAKQALVGIDTRIKQSHEARYADARQSTSGRNLHALYGELQHHKEIQKQLEERVKTIEELRNRQRVVYEAARKDREMLTDIRKQKETAHAVKQSRREQKMIDDTFMARRGRH
jgi:flagellar export protein FliJ